MLTFNLRIHKQIPHLGLVILSFELFQEFQETGNICFYNFEDQTFLLMKISFPDSSLWPGCHIALLILLWGIWESPINQAGMALT